MRRSRINRIINESINNMLFEHEYGDDFSWADPWTELFTPEEIEELHQPDDFEDDEDESDDDGGEFETIYSRD